MTLVYLDRRVVPDVITLILHPKGNLSVPGSLELTSPGGLTHWSIRWKVIPLWTIPAASLLAFQDIGLVPWVPLTQFDGPPETIFRECRARIDQQAQPWSGKTSWLSRRSWPGCDIMILDFFRSWEVVMP